MIRESFIFLDGIREKRERQLWEQGIPDWNHFLERDKIRGISKARKAFYDRRIRKAKQQLYQENSRYFRRVLPNSEMYRLYRFFQEDAVYLDIETNSDFNDITIIGLSDGYQTNIMVKGHNFNKRVLERELSKYQLVVTFNGSSFDLPLLERYFNLHLDVPHIDLRHVCSRIGLTGGLKQIEKRLGIGRPNLIDQMYGGDACLLWRMWKGSGDYRYLNLLIEYNEEDILNLKPIAEHAIDRLWGRVKTEP